MISTDCKKKELTGNFKNNGGEWQGKGQDTTVVEWEAELHTIVFLREFLQHNQVIHKNTCIYAKIVLQKLLIEIYCTQSTSSRSI